MIHLLKQNAPVTPIPEFECCADVFFRKLTLIYGGSNTGKTTIVRNVLFELRNKVPVVFVISPTNSSNNAFTNIVPDAFIRDTVTEEWLAALWNRQMEIMEIYNIVNDISNLREFAKRVNNRNLNDILETIEKKYVSAKNQVLNMSKTLTQKESDLAALLSQRDAKIKAVIQSFVRKKNVKVSELKDKLICQYVDIVPDVLLLLDDCASEFKSWLKKTETIKRIFYAGRQNCITTIITTQDDKEITSELRKNAMVNIFTSSQAALANFERVANNYNKQIKQKAQRAIYFTFGNPQKHPHRKLVFFKDTEVPFYFWSASQYKNFRVGSNSMWELQASMNTSEINLENQLVQRVQNQY